MTLFYYSEHIPKNQCQFHKYILYIRKTPDLNDLKLLQVKLNRFITKIFNQIIQNLHLNQPKHNF